MKNEHSEAGIAEDMIRSFVQTGCAEVHAKTLYEKTLGEIENGVHIDIENPAQVNKALDDLERIKGEIDKLAQLRREMMIALYDMFEGDKTYWCMVKHLGIGAYTMFEAYQASDDDPRLLDLAVEANKAFVEALSVFLGTEITDCAACLSEFMKGEKHGLQS